MGAMMFGKGEKITCITDITLTGGEGEALCLAYKFSRYSFVAPFYLKNDGYVLGVKGDPNTFYKFPAADEVAGYQAAGTMPSPLPPYKIPMFEYAFGYLLEIIIGGMLLWEGMKRLFRGSPQQPVAPGTQSPDTGPKPIG